MLKQNNRTMLKKLKKKSREMNEKARDTFSVNGLTNNERLVVEYYFGSSCFGFCFVGNDFA